MRALFALLLVGCGVHTTCADVDCLSVPTVKLHVVDATTGAPAPLPAGWLPPVFTVSGQNLGTTCGQMPDGGECVTWQFTLYGPQTIHVVFPGYRPADVAVDVHTASDGCCPSPADPTETTVQLEKQ